MKGDGDGSPAMPAYLLDTSAILALLEDEAGADRVQYLLKNETVLLPFLVPLEVYCISFQEKGEETANFRYSLLKALKALHLNEVSEPVLLTAGRLKALHPISLVDAIIAAFARQRDAVLVHKDPEYVTLKDLVRLEALPYKSSRR